MNGPPGPFFLEIFGPPEIFLFPSELYYNSHLYNLKGAIGNSGNGQWSNFDAHVY